MKCGGFNPLRWDCEKLGCFNKKQRPKIEVFAECFPGRINFGDVDAEVELNGHFLQLEWKSYIGEPPTGQRIKFEKYTSRPGFNVIVVCGDAETMHVEAYQVWHNGKAIPWVAATLEDLKWRIARWRAWAMSDKLKKAG